MSMPTSPSDSLTSKFTKLTASSPASAIDSTPTPASAIDSTPPPITAVFDCRALPVSKMSKHIEDRLSYLMRKEIPEAEPLIVREISSSAGALKVREEILSHFSYPNLFPYKSKFLLSFQKHSEEYLPIFGLFVKEFGVDSPPPNKLTATITALESSKLFSPYPLRTLIFQEILIAYLKFLQMKGFKSCFIWACPTELHGFYIFYKCKSTKQHSMASLHEWYVKMLRKAKQEGIVKDFKSSVEFLYDPSSTNTFRKARLAYDDTGLMDLVADCLSKMDSTLSTKEKDHRLKSNLFEELKLDNDNMIQILLQSRNSDLIREDECQNGIFGTPEDFASFCMENDFCFDTVESAQHSTKKMIKHLLSLTSMSVATKGFDHKSAEN